MITMTVSVRGWSNEPSPLLGTTEPSTGPTGPVEAWPAKVAVPSPPAIPPVALKISDSSGITHQTLYASPGTKPDVWITQVIPLLLRTSSAEPTTEPVLISLTDVKSWSAALGLWALSKVARASNKPTARPTPIILLLVETDIKASSFCADAMEWDPRVHWHNAPLSGILSFPMGSPRPETGEVPLEKIQRPSCAASKASVLAHHESYLSSSLRVKRLRASEEHAVVFGAELREVGVRLRRVGFEVEAVPGFLRRSGGG